jgi:hypothetical protein
MRLLVFDHFFDQDIRALQEAATPGDGLRVMPYEPLRVEALRYFPPEAACGLERYALDDLESHRRRWADRLALRLEEEFTLAPYDVFVLPSDLFFYVRAAPEICHRLGVPVVVVQKETTISRSTMREHAERVRSHTPPLADHMTVCSTRQREFWTRAGADPERITVTGQPRFDVYAHERSRPELPYGKEGPVVLFLSYLVDAYHPQAGHGRPVWADLHRQTEQGLWRLARGGWRVLVKPHPQQEFGAERRRIRGEVTDLLDSRVFLVPPGADGRELIAGADVVVGFQTTALLEAMIAGQPVVYTGWDPELARLRGELLPFGDWEDVIHPVNDSELLAPTVEGLRGWKPTEAQAERTRALVETYLGRIDGHASERALAEVRRVASDWAARRSPEAEAYRRAVASRRRPLRARRRAGQRLRELRRNVGALLGR